MSLTDRFKSAWNAFTSKDINRHQPMYGYNGMSNLIRRHALSESSLASTVFNRIAIDASMVSILHVKEDPDSGNQEKMTSGLQKCLMEEANIDQTGHTFVHDLVYSLLDEGVVAVVPVDTTTSPLKTESFNIVSMRVGRIVQWYPRDVRISVYNDRSGREQEIIMPKSRVAIVQNPLYSVVNGPNSTLRRLMRKLAIADNMDDLAASGKLNLILQLPYTVKGEQRTKMAKQRLTQLQSQMDERNRYGIGYIDAAEKITQLNRPVGPQVQDEIEYLTTEFYNQIGLTENVFNGTANEAEMRGYYNRTIDPIIEAVTSEFTRKFLTKTARTQGQKLVAYRDPFKLVPVEQLATIADTFSRNAILTPNEIRSIVGFSPNSNPDSDELMNRNIADVNQDGTGSLTPPDESRQNGE